MCCKKFVIGAEIDVRGSLHCVSVEMFNTKLYGGYVYRFVRE